MSRSSRFTTPATATPSARPGVVQRPQRVGVAGLGQLGQPGRRGVRRKLRPGQPGGGHDRLLAGVLLQAAAARRSGTDGPSGWTGEVPDLAAPPAAAAEQRAVQHDAGADAHLSGDVAGSWPGRVGRECSSPSAARFASLSTTSRARRPARCGAQQQSATSHVGQPRFGASRTSPPSSTRPGTASAARRPGEPPRRGVVAGRARRARPAGPARRPGPPARRSARCTVRWRTAPARSTTQTAR